ncbi:MAG: hypothetical protein IH869_06940 [Chloroflexi bacterium]|nr:hypothetical protein [Chloroflexota bacterium]
MVYREDDSVRLRKERTREAIGLAMDGRWKEAAAVNRELTVASPTDVDAWNRLGKALLELGDAKGATKAFKGAVAIDPANAIAHKNLERLATLPKKGRAAKRVATSLAAHRFFINDGSKTAHVALTGCAQGKDRVFVSPGAPVRLERRGDALAVHTEDGDRLGMVPAKLGRRLSRLMDGGNEYQGAVASTAGGTIRVVLHETFQHPSLRATVSFPASAVTTTADPPNGDAPVSAPVLDMAQWAEDDPERSAKMAGVGAVLDGGMPDDSSLPDVPEEASGQPD